MNIFQKFTAFWISIKFISHATKSKYTKVITLTTVFGIALGVTTLLTVMSIMNGFSYISKNRLVNLLPHITINLNEDYNNTLSEDDIVNIKDYSTSKYIKNLTKIINNRIGANKIQNIYPAFQTKALIINNQNLIPIFLTAVPTEVLKNKLNNLYIPNKNTNYNYHDYIKGIILSSKTLEKLNNQQNISFSTTDNLFKFYNADIAASFEASDPIMGDIALMDLNYANQIFNDKNLSSLNITLINPDKAPEYASELLNQMTLTINNWTQFVGNYFNILEYTKQIMFILLSCIIIVAMFNAVATLTTTLNEKQTEVAVLKTLGSNNFMISRIFIIYGWIITTIGLIIGITCGVILSNNVTSLANILETILGYKLVDPKMYFVDFLPAKIDKGDIFNIILFVYFIMSLALIYPITKARKIMPAIALKCG